MDQYGLNLKKTFLKKPKSLQNVLHDMFIICMFVCFTDFGWPFCLTIVYWHGFII